MLISYIFYIGMLGTNKSFLAYSLFDVFFTESIGS